MKFCKNCGNPLYDSNVTHCPECGTHIAGNDANGNQPYSPGHNTTRKTTSVHESVSPVDTTGKSRIWIILTAILAVGLAVVILLLVKARGEDDSLKPEKEISVPIQEEAFKDSIAEEKTEPVEEVSVSEVEEADNNMLPAGTYTWKGNMRWKSGGRRKVKMIFTFDSNGNVRGKYTCDAWDWTDYMEFTSTIDDSGYCRLKVYFDSEGEDYEIWEGTVSKNGFQGHGDSDGYFTFSLK